MRRPTSRAAAIGRLAIVTVFGGAAVLAACSDQQPVAPREPVAPPPAASAIAAFDCTGTTAGTLSCKPSGGSAGGGSAVLIGGQNQYVKLTSSNVSYDSGTEVFQFDVTVQNLMNEAIGTPDGTVADPEGIQVFFNSGPTVTGGTGSMSVLNPDGTGTFTAGSQPYFAYNQVLSKNQVSSAKTWQLSMPTTVEAFTFTLLVETDVQYLLVINEVMVNPTTTVDNNGEWFEIYNAGTRSVNLQSLVIADSASVRQPYHLITSSVVVPSGGYATLGGNADTSVNGGVTLDHAYGTALQLANGTDAVKISRVYGTDTLTIDRTSYASGVALAARSGFSRELRNPALDNSDMDGSNWATADSAATYGTGQRGTPKAQNSTYTATP